MFNFFKRKSPTTFVLPCGKHIDTLKAYRNLLMQGIDTVIEQYNDKDPNVWCKAEEKFVSILRNIFTLPTLDDKGYGYSDDDTLEVYRLFMEFIEKKGKKGQSLVTSVPSTVAPESCQTNSFCI